MSKRRRSSGGRKAAETKFWAGRAEGDDETATGSERARSIRPTPDPGAVPRSLGSPPLAIDAPTAERHLTAVYEEAVRTATALAAASGLLDTDADDA